MIVCMILVLDVLSRNAINPHLKHLRLWESLYLQIRRPMGEVLCIISLQCSCCFHFFHKYFADFVQTVLHILASALPFLPFRLVLNISDCFRYVVDEFLIKGEYIIFVDDSYGDGRKNCVPIFVRFGCDYYPLFIFFFPGFCWNYVWHCTGNNCVIGGV